MAVTQADGYAEPELNMYCGDCYHMTYAVNKKCAWCESGNIKPPGCCLKERRYQSRPVFFEEPDVERQTRYSYGCRLQMGFALMRGHDA